MRVILDTNTCIYALKLQGRVAERLREHSPDDIAVAIITVAELWFGARKSKRPHDTRREVDAFLAPLAILAFDRAAAESYAEVRWTLERSGRPIGERDLLIASVAHARKLVVVTHNLSEFARVPGLVTEDWL